MYAQQQSPFFFPKLFVSPLSPSPNNLPCDSLPSKPSFSPPPHARRILYRSKPMQTDEGGYQPAQPSHPSGCFSPRSSSVTATALNISLQSQPSPAYHSQSWPGQRQPHARLQLVVKHPASQCHQSATQCGRPNIVRTGLVRHASQPLPQAPHPATRPDGRASSSTGSTGKYTTHCLQAALLLDPHHAHIVPASPPCRTGRVSKPSCHLLSHSTHLHPSTLESVFGDNQGGPSPHSYESSTMKKPGCRSLLPLFVSQLRVGRFRHFSG